MMSKGFDPCSNGWPWVLQLHERCFTLLWIRIWTLARASSSIQVLQSSQSSGTGLVSTNPRPCKSFMRILQRSPRPAFASVGKPVPFSSSTKTTPTWQHKKVRMSQNRIHINSPCLRSSQSRLLHNILRECQASPPPSFAEFSILEWTWAKQVSGIPLNLQVQSRWDTSTDRIIHLGQESQELIAMLSTQIQQALVD